MTEMSEMMQKQMKQTLENLARYDYKVIRFFEDKEELQKGIDDFYNNGFKNVNSKTLTDNYIEEVYEMFVFMPDEGKRTLKAAALGAITGGILGWLLGNTILSSPLLNPVVAGGPVVSTVLGAGIGTVLLATFAAALTLFEPLNKIKPGYHMLTVYADAERKRDIKNILKGLKAIKI